MGVSDVPISSVYPIFGLFSVGSSLPHLYSISISFSGAKADKMRARGASAFREGGMFVCNVGLGTQSARHKNVFKSADVIISSHRVRKQPPCGMAGIASPTKPNQEISRRRPNTHESYQKCAD